MTQATSEAQDQQSIGYFKTTESTETEKFLKFLYSKNNLPEIEVNLAIEKIEKYLKNIIPPEKSKEDPVVILKNPKPLKEHYKLLQQWEGVILEVHKDYFSSKLRDMTGNAPGEEAEIAFDEISEVDLDLVKPGAFFYWSIGRHTSKSGQQTRSSLIIFRRLPAWTDKEIERANKRSEEISAKLGWGIDASDTKAQSKG
jgi:hypothetical protein